MKPPATTSEPTRRPSLLGLTGRLHGGPDLPVGLLEVGAHLLVLHVRGVPLVLLGGLLPLLRLDHLLDRVLPVRHRLLRHVGRAVETAPVVERDVVAFLWRRRHVVERRFQPLVLEDREATQVPGLELAAELAHPGHRGRDVAVQERGGLLAAPLVGDEVDLLRVAAGSLHEQRERQPVVAGGAYRHLARVLLHSVQEVLEVLVLGVGGDGHHVVLGDEAHDHGDVRILIVGVATQVVGHYGRRGDGDDVVFTLVIVDHLRQPHGAGGTDPVLDRQGVIYQLLPLEDVRDSARGEVPSTARLRRRDQPDRPARVPSTLSTATAGRSCVARQGYRAQNDQQQTAPCGTHTLHLTTPFPWARSLHDRARFNLAPSPYRACACGASCRSSALPARAMALSSGWPTTSLTSRATASIESRSTPVLTLIRSSMCTRSSVEMLPVAPGANGHPPRPPTEESNSVTPACSAARTLASAIPRVLCRCSVNSMPGNLSFSPDMVWNTRRGSATPTVSATEMWLNPIARYASAT